MSARNRIPGFQNPSTATIGSRPVVEKVDGRNVHKMGWLQPLFNAAGKPVGLKALRHAYAWTTGTVLLGNAPHWKNEAARRRNGGDMRKAKPTDIIIVPLYRGIPASLASYNRSQERRKQRKTLADRVRAMIAKAQSKLSGDDVATSQV